MDTPPGAGKSFALVFCLLLAPWGCGETFGPAKTDDSAETQPSNASGTAEEQSKSGSDSSTDDNAKGEDSEEKDEKKQSSDEEASDSKREPRTPCTAPDGAEVDPQTIEDATALINALPRPVGIPCFLDVLERPLAVNATDSTLSVQPAEGAASPRIFIAKGNLLMTFVPSGEGSQAIEFSYLTSNQSSVKGEIAFPVTADELPTNAAYQEIAKEGGGTRCASCHAEEEEASSQDFAEGAFESKALRPFDRQAVPLEDLEQEKEACGDSTAKRCEILRSLFRGEDIESYSFPSSMGTLF